MLIDVSLGNYVAFVDFYIDKELYCGYGRAFESRPYQAPETGAAI
jgi:hypothetical protein